MANNPIPQDPVGATTVDARGVRRAHRWLVQVLMLSLLGTALVVLLFAALAATNRLPAPPLTATACLDEKLAFVRSAALAEATLIAVGSSATWRNLDMQRLEHALPAGRALNVATCYLYVDQTAFLSELLLARVPKVTHVLTVLAPRDFEKCDPKDTKIAEPLLARAHLDGLVPGWLVHVINFRPMYILREAFRIKAGREEALGSDRYGSSPLYRTNSWNPPPSLDERCFAALAKLESLVAARHARLVVATVPVMPRWLAEFDPNNRMISQWIEGIRARLGPRSLFIDGRSFHWPDEGFADPVHLLWPLGAKYTDFIATALMTDAKNRGRHAE
jgi:hypothetical protein